MRYVVCDFLDGDPNTLTLNRDSVPFIDIPGAGQPWPFVLIDATQTAVALNVERVTRFFLKCKVDASAQETAVKLSTEKMDYRKRPRGQALDIGGYQSIQHQFPVVYGLSRYGVPDYYVGEVTGAGPDFGSVQTDPAGRNRHAQVRQLRAYLLLFEQVLANAFSQLDQARWLFSLRPTRYTKLFLSVFAGA